jgi:NodT family efflux transporter outer membrane factor (OMF) lipoprotein
MRLTLRIVFCLCATIITGCNISLSEKKQLEYLKPVPNIKHAVNKSLQQSHLFYSGDWPQRQWWLIYHAPELNALITESLISNPSLHEIQSRIQVAQQEAIVTGSILFPLVFFNASYTQQYLSKNGLYRAFNPRLPLNATLLNLALTFNYEFDFWGQNRNLFNEALGKAQAQQAEAAQVELIITTALSQAYFAYKTNLIRRQLYDQLVTVRRQINSLQAILLRKGLSSDLLTYNTTENLFEAKKLRSSINEELSDNKHLINILAGRGPDTPLGIHTHLPSLPRRLEIPKNLALDLIARRPDLMAQIWRAKAWAYKTGASMAAYYPNVNILAFIGLESIAWSKLFQSASGTGGMRPLAINLPIFTAGAIRAGIQASKAQFEAAIFDYNNLLLRSTQEILDVLVFAQTVNEHQKDQKEIVRYAQDRYNLVQLRRKKGLDSQFAVYALQEELIQKQLVKITLLYNQYLASIKLIKALGGGYHQNKVPLVAQYEK